MKHRSLALLLVLALLTIPGVAAAGGHTSGFDAKFSGVIGTVPGAGGSTWTIAGLKVQTTAGTQVKLNGVTEAKAGMWADVTAARAGAGAYTALKITVRAAPAIAPVTEDDEVTVYGPIDAFSDTQWTIAGVKMAVTKGTKIMGTPQVGLLARGVAIKTATGLQAKLLKVTWLEPKRGRGPAQFKGVIEAMPAGLIGMWTISGRQVEVTAATNVQQNQGQAKVGASVHVVTAPPASLGQVPQATLIQVRAESKGLKDKDKGKPEEKGKPDSAGVLEAKGKPESAGKPVATFKPGKGAQH